MAAHSDEREVSNDMTMAPRTTATSRRMPSRCTIRRPMPVDGLARPSSKLLRFGWLTIVVKRVIAEVSETSEVERGAQGLRSGLR